MSDLKYVRTYIDDLLLTTKSDSQDHLHHLDVVFHRIKDAGLKVNTRKSFFARDDLEYLGYWITWAGIQPIFKKMEAINNIAPPTNTREFIGLVNYYCHTYNKSQSHGFAPRWNNLPLLWTEDIHTTVQKKKQKWAKHQTKKLLRRIFTDAPNTGKLIPCLINNNN
jgi:hypothetical protein